MSTLRILHVGDVAAKTGMLALKKLLPRIVGDRSIDFVVVNGENVAGGVGITPELCREILALGVDVVTTGNHVWRQREIRPFIDDEPRLLRPANFMPGQPGRGHGVFETAAGVKVGVLNLVGQVFMDPANNPFRAADAALSKMSEAKIIVVDFHAEVTSEKRAMGFHLEGRATAVLGTHTHVQTADEQILPGGTAYITDVGMTGPHDSVIGMRKELVLERFVTGMPQSFKPAKNGGRLQGVMVESEVSTGRAVGIEKIDIPLKDG